MKLQPSLIFYVLRPCKCFAVENIANYQVIPQYFYLVCASEESLVPNVAVRSILHKSLPIVYLVLYPFMQTKAFSTAAAYDV